MEIVRPDQILTVVLFMGVMGLMWLAVRLKKGPLRQRLSNGRRMQVSEVTALGGDERAILLNIDGADYLIVSSRKGGSSVTALTTGPVSGPVTPTPVPHMETLQ